MNLSYTALRNWACRRKYYYANIKRLEALEVPAPMVYGRMMHKLLELGILREDSAHNRPELAEILQRFSGMESTKLKDCRNKDELITVATFLGYIKSVDKLKHQISGEPEYRWQTTIPNATLVGVADLINHKESYFVEYKYTAAPHVYDFFTLNPQIPLYFYGTGMKRGLVRLIRKPLNKGTQGMLVGEFMDTIIDGIVKRPGYYIQDIMFHSSEFDMLIEKSMIPYIGRVVSEIMECTDANDINAFYQTTDRMMCPNCMYLPICKTNGIPEGMYKTREERPDVNRS